MKKGAIFIEEYVLLNGINQYLFHCGNKEDNPVMLFLHGGPGNSEAIFAHLFQEKWEDVFTVVHWDQRGTGKTLLKNKDKYPNIELMIQDLFEVVQYLKKKYNKEKVIILGHSWGSILGSIFTKKYPKEVEYYIGVGQVINMIENEKVGYEKLREVVLKAKDMQALKIIENIGEYPGEKFDRKSMANCGKIRMLQGKYDLAFKFNFKLFKGIYKSPVFKFSDIIALVKGLKANAEIFDFLGEFDLNSQDLKYEVPIYYILGEKDWQTPYIIAEEYFDKIIAPDKALYLIPSAGHMTMLDQPSLFLNKLLEIHNKHINLIVKYS